MRNIIHANVHGKKKLHLRNFMDKMAHENGKFGGLFNKKQRKREGFFLYIHLYASIYVFHVYLIQFLFLQIREKSSASFSLYLHIAFFSPFYCRDFFSPSSSPSSVCISNMVVRTYKFLRDLSILSTRKSLIMPKCSMGKGISTPSLRPLFSPWVLKLFFFAARSKKNPYTRKMTTASAYMKFLRKAKATHRKICIIFSTRNIFLMRICGILRRMLLFCFVGVDCKIFHNFFVSNLLSKYNFLYCWRKKKGPGHTKFKS